MDKWPTVKVCLSKSQFRGDKFVKDRDEILYKLRRLIKLRENKDRPTSSDFITSFYSEYDPFDIRSLLCDHNFLLTDKGWRNKMIGRILGWNDSKTGLIKVMEDYLHRPWPLYDRKGDYLVQQYSTKTAETFGKKFYINHCQIKDQVNV